VGEGGRPKFGKRERYNLHGRREERKLPFLGPPRDPTGRYQKLVEDKVIK
jgi:hypothetical protein